MYVFFFIPFEFVHDTQMYNFFFSIPICQHTVAKLPVVFIIFIDGNLPVNVLYMFHSFMIIWRKWKFSLVHELSACKPPSPFTQTKLNVKLWTVCVRFVDREIGFTLIQFVFVCFRRMEGKMQTKGTIKKKRTNKWKRAFHFSYWTYSCVVFIIRENTRFYHGFSLCAT